MIAQFILVNFSTMQLEPTKPPQRRRRVRTSCTECRRKKQKCNRGRPCSNCAKRYPPAVCRCTDEQSPPDMDGIMEFEVVDNPLGAVEESCGSSPNYSEAEMHFTSPTTNANCSVSISTSPGVVTVPAVLKKFSCTFPGCNKEYSRSEHLQRH
ncbi:hypothetical protein F5884DRAFT_541982 [Xylogone sp. PMI_703]|nr:hypothetical protein F5884DRAFT_541982 [Xylogone sp. PMI_703]